MGEILKFILKITKTKNDSKITADGAYIGLEIHRKTFLYFFGKPEY